MKVFIEVRVLDELQRPMATDRRNADTENLDALNAGELGTWIKETVATSKARGPARQRDRVHQVGVMAGAKPLNKDGDQ